MKKNEMPPDASGSFAFTAALWISIMFFYVAAIFFNTPLLPKTLDGPPPPKAPSPNRPAVFYPKAKIHTVTTTVTNQKPETK